MKKTLRKWLIIAYVLILCLTTWWYFQVDDVAKISFMTPMTPSYADNVIRSVGVVDYLIDYELMIDDTPTHLLIGNPNIIFKNMDIEHEGISYNENMIIVGSKTAEKDPRKRFFIGEKHEMYDNNYFVEGIVQGEEGVYYFDPSFYKHYQTKAITAIVIPYQYNDRLISMKFVEQSLKGIGIDAKVHYKNNQTKYQMTKYAMAVICLTILFVVTLETYLPKEKKKKKSQQ